jgi:hypothetical protein
MPLGFIIIGIGGFGLVIFMYKRELFINPKAFRVILIISLIMLVLSYILPQFDAFKNTPVNVFKLPIITLLLYRIQRGFFKIAFDREPKNTFWMMHLEKDIWQDTVFNLLFFFSWGAFYLLLLMDII